jgi:hypothetical protein
MNIFSVVALRAYGTPEGVKKEWDTRGRGTQEEDNSTQSYEERCIGPDCGKNEEPLKQANKPVVIPHLDNLELTMTSDAPGKNIHFDKDALKAVLRMALVQLDRDDVESKYLNGATFGKNTTDHYVNVRFSRPGIKSL